MPKKRTNKTGVKRDDKVAKRTTTSGNKAAKNKTLKTTTKPDNNVASQRQVAFANLPVDETWKTWDIRYEDKGGRPKALSGLWIDFNEQTINERWLGFGINIKQNKKAMKGKKTLKKPMKGKKTLTKAVQKTKTKAMHVTKMKAAIAKLGA